jgi:aminoglycoside 3-N-acetyltransferase
VAISRPVTAAAVRDAVRELRLSGLPICIHSSLRSFGEVQGGPDAIVDGFLKEGCTVLVPTFSDAFEVAPPPGMRPERNGWDYSHDYGVPEKTDTHYTPQTGIINPNMGAIPKSILLRNGRVRGNHPINSFTAVGPFAAHLIEGQRPDNVYFPLQRLANLGGYVVLMGVGLDSMTALHRAEEMAGRRLFKRWALDENGSVMMADIGSCSQGFPNLDSALPRLERRVTVGESTWRVFPLQPTLDAAAWLIRENPEITRCHRPGCRICSDAIAGGPIL